MEYGPYLAAMFLKEGKQFLRRDIGCEPPFGNIALVRTGAVTYGEWSGADFFQLGGQV